MPEFKDLPIENNLRFPDGTIDSVEFCVDGIWLKKLGETTLNKLPHFVFVPINVNEIGASKFLKEVIAVPKQAILFMFENISSSESEYSLLNEKGIISAQNGNLKLAIKFFENAIKKNPQKEEAYNNLANAYDDLEDFEKAIDTLEKLISINDRNPDYYFNLGLFYKNLGNQSKRKIFNYDLSEPIGSIGDNLDSAKANFIMAAYLGDTEALNLLKKDGFHLNSRDDLIAEFLRMARQKMSWGFIKSAIKIYNYLLVVDKHNKEAKDGIRKCKEELLGPEIF